MNSSVHDLKKRIHVFSRNERWICFDKCSNRVFELDQDEALILKEVLSNPKIQLNKKQENFIQDLIEILGEPELEYRSLEQINTYYLRVNNNCNLNCAYCHNSSISGEASDKKVLTPEIASIAAKKMWELGAKGVGIHGGDPLYDWGNTEKVLRAIRDVSPEMEIGLTCNGTLVTENIAKILKELCVRVSVEIDGGEANHNSFKKYSDGKSSYEDALKGARILSKCGILAAIESTVSGFREYDAQGYHFLQEVFPEIPIVVARIKSRKPLPWVCHGDDLKKYLKNQQELTCLEDGIFNDVIAGVVNLSSKPTSSVYRCVCFSDKVSIDMNGLVFLCPKKEDDTTFIGNVTDDNFINEFYDNRLKAAERFSSKQLASTWFSNLTEYCVDSTFQNIDGEEEIQDEDILSTFFEDLIYYCLQKDVSDIWNRWVESGF